MDNSYVDDKKGSPDSLFYLECLRAQVTNDLIDPFTKVDDQINDCFKRWKVKLQVEKQHLIEVLQLGDVYERLYSGDKQSSSENIRSEIEYFKEVLRKLQSCDITTNTDFDRILQYDGNILQCDHLTDSEDSIVENRRLDKEPHGATGQGRSRPDINYGMRSLSPDSGILNPDHQGELAETRGDKDNDCVKTSVSERNQQSVYNSSDEVTGGFEQRKENVMPFRELINSVPDLTRLSHQRGDTVSTDNSAAQGATARCHKVATHKHSVTDRNWIDILLFPNYYLVIHVIQKKQANVGTNEWLNKYAKDTGKDADSWLSLPEAGKMCKVSEEGVVAVLQIGGQKRCIAIVKTSDILSDRIKLLYRINVDEAYNAITCLNRPDQKLCLEPKIQLKFAAIFE